MLPEDMFVAHEEGDWVKYAEVKADFERLADVHNSNQRLRDSLENCSKTCDELRKQLELARGVGGS